MSITYNHVQLSFVDSGGNVQVFYPKNTGSDVSIDRNSNTNIPSDVTTVQLLANKLTKVSFSNNYNDLSNIPTLGTAASKNVPSSGNASTSQVVMGNDTRLSDSRNAKDVYSWAKAANKPTYTASEVGLGNVGNFKAVSTVASQGLTDTEKSNARANIGAGTSSLTIGTSSSTAAAGNHTHSLSMATDSGTNQLTMAANTKYKLTAGGSSYIFTTPPDNNTWRGIQDNLTSDSTTDSLSAKQGKALKALVDGKAASSHTHTSIASRGNVTCETTNTRPAVDGLSMSYAYNNGYPDTYGNVITLKGTGDSLVFLGWSGTSGAHAPVYIRSRRDTSSANWSAWAQVYTSAHPDTTRLPLSGGTMTGQITSAKPNKWLITGSGTAATTSGSNYIPAKWTFNTGINPSDGLTIWIKIPVAGHDYGVFVSINNGSSYQPVCLNGADRLTTHFPSGQMLCLTYDANAVTNSVFPVAGATARSNITGSWRVTNYRDNNTTYSITQYTASPSSLANFVESTAKSTLIVTLKFKDTGNYLGFGTNQWIRGYIQYQNAYGSGAVWGHGIVYIQDTNFYKLLINNQSGSTTAFTVTKELIGGGSTPTTLSATLAANATSVSFTNSAISTTAMIDVYTSVPNLNYTNMTISGTTLTLTYPKQSAAVTVKLVIST